MKRLLFLPLVFFMTQPVHPQTGITGVWRAVGVAPDGTADGALRDLFFEFLPDGASLKATVTGAPIVIREGRIDGNQITLSGVLNNQPVSFTGTLSGDDLVLSAVGLAPEPFTMAAHRVTRVTTVSGSVSDAALMRRLLEEFKVPGVSIAVIKDFKVALAVAYGLADAETRAPVTTRTMFQAGSVSKTVAAMVSLKAVQDKRFLRAIRLERAPGSGFEYSGGGVLVQQLALTDAVGRPFDRLACAWVLDRPDMADSTFQQPLPTARQAQAARAHDWSGARMKEPWRVHPEQAVAARIL
jgi:hypothetical protein